MDLDIVIVTYRSAAHLPGCLASLPDDANIVVVDNASGDGSAEIAEAAEAQVIRNAENVGFAAAANQGAREGKGELLLFLNPDAVVNQTDLGILTDRFRRDTRLAAAGPRLITPDGAEQRAWWPFPSSGATWAEAIGLHRLVSAPQDVQEGFVVGACLVIRRRAFEALGGFDERFWLYGEEADLCRRLLDDGWRVHLVPEAVATHIGGASGDGVGGVTFEHFQRGAEHYIIKHHGAGALVLHRIGLLAGSLLRLPVLALRRHPTFAVRRAIVRRLLHRLLTSPLQVAA